MNEEFLHFIWAHGLFDQQSLITTDNESVEIFNSGELNRHAGPDFNNAHIRIDDTDWFGHIEIHINSDEWMKHNHQNDPAYNNVTLHVVYNETEKAKRQDGSLVPCLELKGKILSHLIDNYEALKFSHQKIPCMHRLKDIPAPVISQALDRAMVQRLQRKSLWMEEWLRQSEGDWMTVFFASLVRSFGFGTNGEAFELLALHLPVKEICRAENDPLKVMAIVFGIAGFLEESPNDAYQAKLRQEWIYQRKRLNLHTLDKSVFKFMRMRPGNFPSIRLAQLSAILADFQIIFQDILLSPNIPTMLRMLGIELSEYWNNHYQFGKKSNKHQCALSLAARQVIIINAFVPFIFQFGYYTKDQGMMENALDILRKLPPENNHIIRDWAMSGVECTSAFDSQSLLELRKYSCDKRACTECPIGSKIIKDQSF
jgi:hypothetical protein